MRGVEVFVVLALGTFCFAVMPRSGRNRLVLYTTLFNGALKQSEVVRIIVDEALAKLTSVVGLNTFYSHFHFRKMLYHVLCKLSGAVGAVFLEYL